MTAIQTMAAALPIRIARGAAPSAAGSSAPAGVRAIVVSATVTTKGIEVDPVEAARDSELEPDRLAAEGGVGIAAFLACEAFDDVGSVW